MEMGNSVRYGDKTTLAGTTLGKLKVIRLPSFCIRRSVSGNRLMRVLIPCHRPGRKV